MTEKIDLGGSPSWSNTASTYRPMAKDELVAYRSRLRKAMEHQKFARPLRRYSPLGINLNKEADECTS